MSIRWFSVDCLGTAGASVTRDVCTQLFDAYKHSLSGKLMRLRPVLDTFSDTKLSKHSKPNSILPGPPKKKPFAKAPQLLALCNEIPVKRAEGSVTDSGFGRESSDSWLVSENCHEADGRSSKHPKNGLCHADNKKKKVKASKDADDEDWGIIGASWELDWFNCQTPWSTRHEVHLTLCQKRF